MRKKGEAVVLCRVLHSLGGGWSTSSKKLVVDLVHRSRVSVQGLG